VHNTLGFGFLESVYRKALAVEFQHLGIAYAFEQRFELEYRGVDVGTYRADLIVDCKVVVEVKTGLATDPSAEAQLLNYLRASHIELGLVIHFGLKVEVQRLVMSDAMKGIMASPITLSTPR
jgi:GxxExxY protein